MRDKLFISFSGGKTSAYMTYKLLSDYKIRAIYKDIVVLFANTGQEYEETLQFVSDCDKHLGFNTIWLEASIINQKRKGTSFKVVNYESANRSGFPYEKMCEKYGIPNITGPFCTRELKLQPMTSYLRSIGWRKNSYDTCIGIRFDELDRVSKSAIQNGIIYPLIDWRITKKDVQNFWYSQSFNLQLPEHKGNCKWCWKKSDRKLYTLVLEDESIFDFPDKLENLYSLSGNHSIKEPRYFFRGNRPTKLLLEQAKNTEFTPFTDSYYVSIQNFEENLDTAGGCSESCEIFS